MKTDRIKSILCKLILRICLVLAIIVGGVLIWRNVTNPVKVTGAKVYALVTSPMIHSLFEMMPESVVDSMCIEYGMDEEELAYSIGLEISEELSRSWTLGTEAGVSTTYPRVVSVKNISVDKNCLNMNIDSAKQVIVRQKIKGRNKPHVVHFVDVECELVLSEGQWFVKQVKLLCDGVLQLFLGV